MNSGSLTSQLMPLFSLYFHNIKRYKNITLATWANFAAVKDILAKNNGSHDNIVCTTSDKAMRVFQIKFTYLW